ncbi:MAG: hypothetical protein NZM38_11280 [Cytophagales bacterium]|nr:hypothetical protein [Cytophagales bacterium]MDW8385338.1 hypothetical protein [Flammeovirgaceae bacterium]
MMKYFTLLIIACYIKQFVWAQTLNMDKSDVLKKPEMWAKIRQDYHNDKLWAQYFATDVFNLTKEQLAYIERWKGIFHQEEILEAEEAQLKLQQLRQGSATSQNSASERYFQSLVNNIAQNFVMIEDYFNEEFKKYGGIYHYYQEKYPNGNYDKHRWVQEHEKKLRELKEKH